MSISKEQVLNNLEEAKKYIQEIEEVNKKNIQIKNRFTGKIIYESEKTTYREAVEEAVANEANLSGADLSGADLYGADLSGAELASAKFYGKTTTPKTLKESQIDDFLAALGFKREG